ncbi:MAG: ATP-binding cassette domain-containing protein [Pseudomonadota bacterium]
MAAPPLLTLSEIALTFGGDPVFEDVSLALPQGARMCLVGRNGSGKSTLMKVIAGHVTPDSGTRFVKPGVAVAYMDQDPDFSGYDSLDAFARDGLDPSDGYRVEIAFEGLKLDPSTDPAAASGGERRRAALARIIAAEPDVMLLDEPTNHLDIEAIAWLEEYLRSLRSAYVVISHDRAFLRRLSNGILWVDRGAVRRLDQGFEAFEAWRDKTFEEEDLARHKLDRLIKAEGRWAVEGISARRKRNMGRVRRLGELRAERASQIRRTGAADFAFDTGSTSGKLVVDAKGIAKSWGERTVLQPLDLRIQRGDRVALVGPNGAGKTTLLNILIGDLAPDAGTLKLGTGLTQAVLDQNRAALDPTASLWDTLALDPLLGVSGRSDQIMVRGTARHVVGYLKDFLFSEAQVRSPVGALSGGEKARLLLARLMAQPSNLLVLDEPTNDLDIETLDLLQEVIDGYEGTVLLVSHDRDFIDRVATTTLSFEGAGRVTVYAGGYSDMLAQRGSAGTRVQASGKAKAKGPSTQAAAKPKPVDALSFKQADRLKKLPDVIARLEAEIAKLEAFLATKDLFATDPAKFTKASEGLAERQAALAQAEDEWLELAALREAAG